MSVYLLSFYLHIGSVCLSGAFFLIRGLWMMAENPALQQKWVRISPHVIDTVLLLSSISLCVISGQYPFVEGWLTVKLIALFAYIGLGVFALKRGKTKAIRSGFFAAAILTFVFMVSVAFTRDAAGFLSLI
ncbi:MAG: putative membrane protein SirB2 [Candidatus Azotimanducaceae bacterium]|jgi:uncharacterized membrane protein SirB2